jgi:hypothetical protein
MDLEAGVSGGDREGTWGEDGGWWGDEDMDLQAMGKSLEWDFCGLALAVSGELVGMGFFFFSFFSFPGLSIFKLTQ